MNVLRSQSRAVSATKPKDGGREQHYNKIMRGGYHEFPRQKKRII